MEYGFLKKSFFQANPVTKEFFQPWREAYAWNDVLLPIYQWQEVLFVASSQPTEALKDLKIPGAAKICIVHCEQASLTEIWQNLHTEVPKPAEKEEFSAENLFSVPEPAALDTSAPLTLSDSETSEESPAAEEESAPETGGLPEGLQMDSLSLKETTEVVDFTKPVKTLKPEPTLGSEQLVADHTVLQLPPVPKEDSDLTQAPVKPNFGPNWVPELFERLNSHFRKSMILLVHSNKAKPWNWNAGLAPAQPNFPEIDLNQLGPFYVVQKTLKPYHGNPPPVESLVQFCQFWNKGAEFQCLSIVPLMSDSKVFGFLMAETEGEGLQLNKLELLEKMAQEIEEHLKANPQLLKAS
jgi:hypothetical protein